ncbi:hypothetical protein [Halopiger djelfimassiliensis]|uniref:hypothetical protein n=1 Tax=Halopiger djelfimassiliensis TaxID=1293047 RepID=UPI0006776225|nr:hypothetical protein [Halopiger djelfimassiliensis]
MGDAIDAVRYAGAFVLIGGGIAGTVAPLVGIETVSPAYFAVAIAAGAGALPESTAVWCRLRKRLPV